MKTVADLKPGDVAYIDGQPFTVRSVHTSGGNTTLVFEDVPATRERCEALKKLARDTGGVAAMVPVQLAQIAPDTFLLRRAEEEIGTENATDPNRWWFDYMKNGSRFCENGIAEAQQSWENSGLRKWLNEQFHDDAEEMRRYLDEQHQSESGSGGTGNEGRP